MPCVFPLPSWLRRRLCRAAPQSPGPIYWPSIDESSCHGRAPAYSVGSGRAPSPCLPACLPASPPPSFPASCRPPPLPASRRPPPPASSRRPASALPATASILARHHRADIDPSITSIESPGPCYDTRDEKTVRAPTTWTILRHDGPNHLGLLYNVLPAHQMALIISGCVPFSPPRPALRHGPWAAARSEVPRHRHAYSCSRDSP